MLKYSILLCSLLLSLNVFSAQKILVLGDSLTEGHNLNESASFPSQLEVLIKSKGFNYEVINGGVSGSTTASGLSRLTWFLKAKPKLIIVALGANDGLRGVKLSDSKKNLEEIIKKGQNSGAKIILAGMQIPPNYGPEYTAQFKTLFNDLSKKHKTELIPFLLKNVAGQKDLNLEDGIHPNKKGYKIIAETVFNSIKEFL